MSHVALRVTPEAFAPPAVIVRWRSRAAVLAVVCGVVAPILGFNYGWSLFLRAWLLGFLFMLGLTTGSLALLMLQYVTGGNWGRLGRRIWEAGAGNLWIMFLLWLPIAFGMRHLYSWVSMPAAQLGIDKVRFYLNPTGFWVRGIIYFLGWGLLYWRLSRWSKQEEAGATNPAQFVGIQNLSGFGLVFYAAAITFASIDWAMSLDPKWWSTVWGMLFMIGQVLTTFCFTIVLMVKLADLEPLSGIFKIDYLHDFGKWMLTFVVFWAYLSFSQWLIIWSGNLLSEIRWYLMRLAGGWQYVGPLLIFVHFVFPFALLLSRSLKRDRRRLVSLAILLLFMRLVDLFWLTAPNFYNAWEGAGLKNFRWPDAAMYVVCPLAIGGIWLFFFFNRLGKRSLMPVNDPHFVEMLEAKHG